MRTMEEFLKIHCEVEKAYFKAIKEGKRLENTSGLFSPEFMEAMASTVLRLQNLEKCIELINKQILDFIAVTNKKQEEFYSHVTKQQEAFCKAHDEAANKEPKEDEDNDYRG